MMAPLGASSIGATACAIGVLLAAGGCQSQVTCGQIGLLDRAAEVEAGRQTSLSIEVDNPANVPIEYRWIATAGEIEAADGSPVAIYTAPESTGLEAVTVQIVDQRGKLLCQKSLEVEVRGPSSGTAEPGTPSPPEGTIAVGPTSSASAAPTDTVGPCSLASLRVPIDGSAVSDLEAWIESPEHCRADVPSGGPTVGGGGYSGNLTGRQLWVLAFAQDGRYYVQSGDAATGKSATTGSGRWSTNLYLGKDGVSEQFDLVLVVTGEGSPAARTYADWLRDGSAAHDFPGFVDPPAGTTELDAVTVRTVGSAP